VNLNVLGSWLRSLGNERAAWIHCQRAARQVLLVAMVSAMLPIGACGGGAIAPAAPAAKPAQEQPSGSGPSAAGGTAVGASAPTAEPSTSAAPRARWAVSYASPSGNFLHTWVAQEGGYFQRNGLDVDLQLVQGGTSVAALVSGELQVAMVAGGDALGAVAEGADLVVLGTVVPVYNFLLVVAPEIQTPEQLRGTKLGVTSAGSATAIALRVALRKMGLDPDRDVTILALGGVTRSLGALREGLIQGTIAAPGQDEVVLHKGGYRTLVNLAELNLPAATQSIVVRRSLIASDRELVQRFVDAIVQATAALKNDQNLAMSALVKYTDQTDQEINDLVYQATTRVFPTLPYPRAEQFADIQFELGLENEKLRGVDVRTIIDASFVESAANRRVGAQ
jgi:NitT/TauT family transport system substrate-binding protein